VRTPKPTAFGSFGYGWQQLWKYFLHLFLISIVVSVAGSPMSSIVAPEGDAGFTVLFLLATGYSLLVFPIVKWGGDWMYLRFMRDERPNVGDIFQGFKTNYLNIVLANLLLVAIVGIGFVLFLIPGIIFACRLAFVPYLVMDKGLDPVAAIEKSWNMTRSHGWRIFAMYLVAILLFCVGLVLLVVPAFFAWILGSCAFASLYHAVDLEEKAALNGNGTT